MEVMDETELLERGLDALRDLLGPGWQVTPSNVTTGGPANIATVDTGDDTDLVVTVRSPDGMQGQLLGEAKRSLTPAQVRTALTPKVNLMRKFTGDAAILVVAPWLSPRTRSTLEELGYAYLDLTGNTWIRLNRPGVFIDRPLGAQQDPSPRGRSHRQRLKGPKVGRLVRLLTDVAPPYRALDLALAADLSQAYVSRLLETLEEDGLITRSGRLIVDVDWPELLRARAAQYVLLGANAYVGTIAPAGIEATLKGLRAKRTSIEQDVGPVAVTGPWATKAVTPTAVAGQLMLYVPPGPGKEGPLDQVAASLGLLRSDTGANVLLLRAADPVVFERRRDVTGVPHVALSQLVLDNLTGPGRMPAEGEALIERMRTHDDWRRENLTDLTRSGS